ncbi:hypothetical protein AC579_6947 [Pseudocercospora musae]|uniref:Amidase domain-containing protein n=1 Tax=Pseudocercospora musae TaxID=113226 RepID=A0A139INU2_9PEZI|nr:hypothetical protein AC579_6947 [Pseudocercospora musae]
MPRPASMHIRLALEMQHLEESKLNFVQQLLWNNAGFSNDVTTCCVQRRVDAGALLIGKTTLYVCRLGTDVTGNIPTFGPTYCGVYGLKTSHGRVSKRPSTDLARSTGVAGPIAANMIDLELG